MSAAASAAGTLPSAASSANVFFSTSGLEKMLRTANMHSVPTPFSRVRGSRRFPAFWCIMLKPSMKTSQHGSSTARASMVCSGSRGPVSLTARWRSLPFAFSRSRAGTMSSMALS